MREIKFRVYDILKKVYIIRDDLVLHLYDDSICYNERGNLIKVPENRIVLEQYTGLKDKNGVEIYEGDVVEVKEKEYQYNEVITNKYQVTVVFREGCFKLVEENGLMDMLYNKAKLCKVIGNIHDKEKQK